MTPWQYKTLGLALTAAALLASADRLLAQNATSPTRVRLVVSQMDAPVTNYGSSTYYEQKASDEPSLVAPSPSDDLPYETEVSDLVPPAPKLAAKPAAPAPVSAPAPAKPAAPPEAQPQAAPCPAGPPAPWRLVNSPCLDNHGIKVGGWLEQGITFNADNPADRFNGPVATNDRDGEYQLNQLWAFIDRPVGQRGSCWELGGRIDMTYGTDYRYGISHGLDDRINGMDSYYGLVIPQAYAAIGNDRLSVIAGHYAGILNYEQVPSPANFFYSHSYQMSVEPLLVTGVQASYKLTDNWSATGGFNRGWMMWEDYNESLDFMGGIAWTGDNKRDRLAYNVDIGPQDPVQPGDTIGQRQRFEYSLIYQHDFTQRFTYAFEHVLGVEDDGAGPGRNADWYGLAQYFYYTLSPTWKAGMRVEWFRDDDGTRIAGVGHLVPGHGWNGGPGFAGDFYELTMGLNWRPSANLVVRPEVRWDWYRGTTDVNQDLPFDGGNRDSQFLFATDMILTF